MTYEYLCQAERYQIFRSPESRACHFSCNYPPPIFGARYFLAASRYAVGMDSGKVSIFEVRESHFL